MLQAPELPRAMGFGEDYVLDAVKQRRDRIKVLASFAGGVAAEGGDADAGGGRGDAAAEGARVASIRSKSAISLLASALIALARFPNSARRYASFRYAGGRSTDA
jgi:hypothetical protein